MIPAGGRPGKSRSKRPRNRKRPGAGMMKGKAGHKSKSGKTTLTQQR